MGVGRCWENPTAETLDVIRACTACKQGIKLSKYDTRHEYISNVKGLGELTDTAYSCVRYLASTDGFKPFQAK